MLENVSAWNAVLSISDHIITTTTCSLGKHHCWKKWWGASKGKRWESHSSFGEAREGDREKIFHHTDLFQSFQCLRNHALTVLQFAHSHQLDSPQWMEARIIQSIEEKGGKCVTVSSHLHSHCLCRELLGWDCKVIVNVNKVLREN